MGRYYGEAAGLSAEVAAVAEEHYAPLGPSDDVPTAPLSVTVSLADKLDTLTGFWAIDEKPTGSKDPFALRRAALGVIRLVLERNVSVRLGRFVYLGHLRSVYQALKSENKGLRQNIGEVAKALADVPMAQKEFLESISTIQASDNGASLGAVSSLDLEQIDPEVLLETAEVRDLLSFFHDRLKVFLKDQGIRHDIIDACIAMPGNDDLTLLVKRAKALSETLATDDGENLLQGFKRANNILTQAEDKDGVAYEYGADIKFAETDSEKALFAALDAADAKIAPAMKDEDFTTAMTAMADLRGPIDAFFDDVKINADSEIIRRNRLNLLSRIRTICLSVADLTRIEG